MYWLMNLGVVGHRWENRLRLKCVLFGALCGSTTACCYRRSVLENNVKGGLSCGYGLLLLVLLRICESRVAGMLG